MEPPIPETNESSSSKIYSISTVLVIFMIITITTLGGAITTIFMSIIGGRLETERENILETGMATQITKLRIYLEDRHQVLKDHAFFSVITIGMAQVDENIDSLKEFMGAFSLLGDKPQIVLVDFEGKHIHATQETPLFNYSSLPWISEMMEGKIKKHLDVSHDGTQFFWQIATPIIYNNSPKGVLIAEIPVPSLPIFSDEQKGLKHNFSLFRYPTLVVSFGPQLKNTISKEYFLEELNLTAKYEIDNSEFITGRRELFIHVTAILLFLMFFFTLLAVLIERTFLVIPLKQLMHLISLLSKHKKVEGVPTYKILELQLLFTHFKTMADSLEITLQELEKERNTLEEQVKERTLDLEQKQLKIEQQNWIKTGDAELNIAMRGELELEELGHNILIYLASHLDAKVGAFYVVTESSRRLPYRNNPKSQGNKPLKMVSSYAYTKEKNFSNEFDFGEGLVGQAAREKRIIHLTNIPENYLMIRSGVSEIPVYNILVIPILFEGVVKGVLELGRFHEFTELQREFINQVVENIGVSLNSALFRIRLKELLEATQYQAEKLKTQQEELRASNEELETQARALRDSEANLQAQQEELRITNEELEERTKELEKQQQEIKNKNLKLEKSRQSLEEKSRELEISSKYKSEFLANMSHELRSPLNSMLLLAQSLGDNKDGNLTGKQIEFAHTIHGSGKELLNLINDILDLSKIESGRVEVVVEEVLLEDFVFYVNRNFIHQTEKKGVDLKTELQEGLPDSIYTDRQRVEQVIKNFLSNALKFTPEGQITFQIARPTADFDGQEWNLEPERTIAFSVSDTGIGIPDEKQQLIFQAFRQADGSTSRKYGGTGLGLSISTELAKLLEGGIGLQSQAASNQQSGGSTFTLYLPEKLAPQIKEGEVATKERKLHRKITDYTSISNRQEASPVGKRAPSEPIHISAIDKEENPHQHTKTGELPDSLSIMDDRSTISKNETSTSSVPGDSNLSEKTLLLIEDDVNFAKFLLDLAHDRGFKVLSALNGEIGLQLAQDYKPSAIILDIGLPGINGWKVMEELKNHAETRHIPVYFISVMDESKQALQMGAIGFLSKPVSQEKLDQVFQKIEKTISKIVKHLLIVEDDEAMIKGMRELIGNGDVETVIAENGQKAQELLKSQEFDCMVLDLKLPDISGLELLQRIKNEDPPPVIVYTGKDLTEEEEHQLQQYSQIILIKGATSSERLLGEITLFLHRVESNLPENQQKILKKLYNPEQVFYNKTILIVDDDARNVFALSHILTEKGLKVLKAFDGKEALNVLNTHSEIDLVLMDIMMPEMDGYETMREIRKQKNFQKLPIIALTAKAMKEDRHKCIEAGATDYLPKPVDTSQLLALIQVWLNQ